MATAYLDTNVLVRLITGDDQTAAAKAFDIVRQAEKGELFIHDAVLVELCFILEFHDYAMKRSDIAEAISTLLETSQITADTASEKAIILYAKHPKLDYADCLLYVLGGQHGVHTFDKTLQKQLLD